ncbi:MAG: hypothetical protein CL578_22075 [Alteromonadaceae bacterium]|nr:hypothetical protein [Alteromonadaceae bacterium]
MGHRKLCDISILLLKAFDQNNANENHYQLLLLNKLTFLGRAMFATQERSVFLIFRYFYFHSGFLNFKVQRSVLPVTLLAPTSYLSSSSSL